MDTKLTLQEVNKQRVQILISLLKIAIFQGFRLNIKYDESTMNNWLNNKLHTYLNIESNSHYIQNSYYCSIILRKDFLVSISKNLTDIQRQGLSPENFSRRLYNDMYNIKWAKLEYLKTIIIDKNSQY
jgi:hypothetical protein